MRVTPPPDFRLLADELREVCARYGLVPGPGEQIDGWVAIIRTVGYDEQGREYRRHLSLTSPGADRVDVADMLKAKLEMTAHRRLRSRRAAH